MSKRSGQEGQSLAEFVLCLPVLLLLIFGIMQVTLLGVTLAFTHYAASCALRSYTVFYSQGHSIAIQKAGQAMEQAMAWCHPMPDMDLKIWAENPKDGPLSNTKYQGVGPLFFRARLTAEVPLFITLVKKRSVELNVESFILSEKTRETD